MLYLISHPTCACFVPIIKNIHYILIKNGIPAQILRQYDPNNDDGSDLYLVIWNSMKLLPRRCILYNFDPFIPVIINLFTGILRNSPNTTIVKFIDYYYGNNSDFISTLNVPYVVVPYGYSSYYKYMENNHCPKDQDKVIDVLFYGNIDNRRRIFIDEINKMCNEKSYKFAVYNNTLYNDTAKITRIKQSKIVVSMASENANKAGTNDLARISQVLSMNQFVVADRVGDKVVEDKMSEYVPHFTRVIESCELIDHYLTHEDDRQHMIEKCAARFKKDFNFETMLVNAINIDSYNCYAKDKKIMVLVNDSVAIINRDIIGLPIDTILTGITSNNMKIYTNIATDITETTYLDSDADVADAAKLVDFILLINIRDRTQLIYDVSYETGNDKKLGTSEFIDFDSVTDSELDEIIAKNKLKNRYKASEYDTSNKTKLLYEDFNTIKHANRLNITAFIDFDSMANDELTEVIAGSKVAYKYSNDFNSTNFGALGYKNYISYIYELAPDKLVDKLCRDISYVDTY